MQFSTLSRTLAGMFALGLLTVTTVAQAQAVVDPTGDLFPGYTPATSVPGYLDVVSAEVIFDGTSFLFTTTLAAPIPASPLTGTAYVWGVNRGGGTNSFVGAAQATSNQTLVDIVDGITWNAIVNLNPVTGNVAVNRLGNPAGGAITLPGAVNVSGSTISARVDAGLLPTTGSDLANYTWNLWPRTGLAAGLAGVTDFAPDTTNNFVTVVPEPGTYALLVSGLVGAGLVLRRRRK